MNMLGYYRNAELTREAFTQDGYFRTGDRGEIDALGRLRLVGRLKEEFKTSKADMWRLRRSKNVSRYSRSLNRLRSSVPA
jgi:long-subunit acyl-CoA synthetase (AMP-forming)